jgi:peptidoglycan/xylan/chitin deacetylase (PgdA/CDA1 family)
MEIGSHGIDHAVLTGLPPEEAWREISESKRMLEEKLGAAVTSFCYPKGCYDRSHRDMVARAGYRTACTASPKRSAPDDMLQLPRLAVLRSDAFSIFKQKIRGRMDWFSLER